MCVDRFKRWFTASALPRQDVQTVISAFLGDWVSNYGAPLKCATDQTKIFLSNDWQQRMKFHDTFHSKSSAQANAQTERFNLTVKNALKPHMLPTKPTSCPWSSWPCGLLYRGEFDASAALMLYGSVVQLRTRVPQAD